jgi:hypothetical protein
MNHIDLDVAFDVLLLTSVVAIEIVLIYLA